MTPIEESRAMVAPPRHARGLGSEEEVIILLRSSNNFRRYVRSTKPDFLLTERKGKHFDS